jgi:hypothetical protein
LNPQKFSKSNSATANTTDLVGLAKTAQEKQLLWIASLQLIDTSSSFVPTRLGQQIFET